MPPHVPEGDDHAAITALPKITVAYAALRDGAVHSGRYFRQHHPGLRGALRAIRHVCHLDERIQVEDRRILVRAWTTGQDLDGETIPDAGVFAVGLVAGAAHLDSDWTGFALRIFDGDIEGYPSLAFYLYLTTPGV